MIIKIYTIFVGFYMTNIMLANKSFNLTKLFFNYKSRSQFFIYRKRC